MAVCSKITGKNQVSLADKHRQAGFIRRPDPKLQGVFSVWLNGNSLTKGEIFTGAKPKIRITIVALDGKAADSTHLFGKAVGVVRRE